MHAGIFTRSVALFALAVTLAGCAARDDYYGDTTGAPIADVSVFYEDLQPYGRWVDYPPYGWAWTPYGMDPFWRPYTNGRWAYTDYGWTWLSDHDWGWAPFHYGRWVDDPFLGWVWIPDTVWGPAWVGWCSDDDWIGWAPLPPDARWDRDDGIRVRTKPVRYDWSFVPRNRFLDRRVGDQVVPAARNETILRRTRPLSSIKMRGGRPVNLGPDVSGVERATGTPVERLEVRDRPRGSAGAAGLRAGVVPMYRPRISGDPRRAQPPEPVRRDGDGVTYDEAARERERMLRELDERSAQERQQLDGAHRRDADADAGRNRAAAEAERRRQAAEVKALQEDTQRRERVIEERTRRKVIRPREAPPPPAPPPPAAGQREKSSDSRRRGGGGR